MAEEEVYLGEINVEMREELDDQFTFIE